MEEEGIVIVMAVEEFEFKSEGEVKRADSSLVESDLMKAYEPLFSQGLGAQSSMLISQRSPV